MTALGRKLKERAARERAASQVSIGSLKDQPLTPEQAPITVESSPPSPSPRSSIKTKALKSAALRAAVHADKHGGGPSAFPGKLAAKAKAVNDALKATNSDVMELEARLEAEKVKAVQDALAKERERLGDEEVSREAKYVAVDGAMVPEELQGNQNDEEQMTPSKVERPNLP